MKEFITAFKAFTAELMARIAKKEIPISTVNGNKTGTDNGIPYDTAQQIIESASKYKKESSQYEKDETKIVVSKRVFKNFLRTVNSSLFLLEHMDTEGVTTLWINAVDYVTCRNSKRDRQSYFWGIISLSLLLGFVIFSFYKNIPQQSSNGGNIVFGIIFLIILLACIAYISNTATNNNSIKEADLRMSTTLNSQDLLEYGHDSKYIKDGEVLQKNFETLFFQQKTQIIFEQRMDYSALVNFAIQKNGRIGYLIRKNSPATITWKKLGHNTLSMLYSFDFIPVVILEESIIFDVAYIDRLVSQRQSNLEKLESISKTDNSDLQLFL